MNTFIIKLLSLIGLIFIVTMASSKACDYPITVENGDTDCSGVLLSEEQFIKASNDKKKLRIQDLKIAEYEGLEELYEQRHKGYKKELKEVKSELRWLEIKSNAGYVISFAFGALITGYVVRAVIK